MKKKLSIVKNIHIQSYTTITISYNSRLYRHIRHQIFKFSGNTMRYRYWYRRQIYPLLLAVTTHDEDAIIRPIQKLK